MYDIVLNHGIVCDPKNHVYRRLNLGIRDGRIVELSRTPLRGKQEYDCTGKIVSPGFVDIHAHEDAMVDGVIQTEITRRALLMGVTTMVCGNCGTAPLDWDEYRRVYDGAEPVNQVLLAGHTTLRRLVGAEDKYAPVTEEQIEQMAKLLRGYLERGCRGLSFGIRYEPGVTLDEMCALSRVVREYDGIVAAHIREDAVTDTASFEEFLEVGIRTGVRLQISHIGSMAAYGLMEECLGCVDACAAAGVDVMMDCYPYDAFSTHIGATTYDDGFTDRYGEDLSVIEVVEGEFIGPVPNMEVFQQIRREHPEYLTVGHVMRQDEMDQALLHPRTMVGSDGILSGGKGHPRAAGTFPRFIKDYVRERGLIPLVDAIAKCTWIPAERMGLDRGTLGIGAPADITVFDLGEIQDHATFTESALPPEGIELVLLGGIPAMEQGRILSDRLGHSL